MKSHLTIPIAALVAALLCFLLQWVQRADVANRHEGESTRAVSPPPHHSVAGSAKGHPSKLPRAATSAHHTPPTHTPGELKDFIIPSFSLEDASLEDALLKLFSEYGTICEATGESPVIFNLSFDGSPSARINLELRQISFLSVLNRLATQAGMTLDRKGSHLFFSEIPLDESEPLVAREFMVPPDFISRLQQLTARPTHEDPFGPPSATPADTKQEGVLDYLRHLGLLRIDNSSAFYVGSNSTLLLKGTQTDARQLSQLIEDLSAPPTMIKTEIKLIATENDLDLPDGPLGDPELGVLLRELSQQKGTDIMTQPSITSLPGQPGTIEVGRELVIPDPEDPRKFSTEWIGTRIKSDPGGYGFGLMNNGSMMIQNEAPEGPESEPLRSEAAFGQFQQSGQTIVVRTTTPEGGPLYAFVTTNTIDPTGRIVNGRTVPEQEGE